MNDSRRTHTGTPTQPEPNQVFWHVVLHLSVFVLFVIPLGAILGPLIVWMIKKGEIKKIDTEGRQVLNFHVTWTLAPLVLLFIALVVALIFGGGFFILLEKGEADVLEKASWAVLFFAIVVPVFSVLFFFAGLLFEIIMSVVNALKASQGQKIYYPLRIQFLGEKREEDEDKTGLSHRGSL